MLVTHPQQPDWGIG
ncbi:MAG: DUF3553 domain-containing protein, partial [Loktanella sp.]|nr:DUF3553 domain-containing protein [Loktanella sp.]